MSAASAPQQDRLTAQQRAHEPSMEEILASIRRIIADDKALPASAAEALSAAAPSPVPAAPVTLQLVPAATVAKSVTSASAPADGPDVTPQRAEPVPSNPPATDPLADMAEWPELSNPPTEVFEPEFEPEPVMERIQEPLFAAPSMEPVALHEPLVSQQTNASVSQAFSQLASTMMSQNARTLEDLVGDMLRPMLKSWLDDNLPVLVERLVRVEIERVARGGR